ncbi:MAG TPA: lipopolysaccharide biosynthesis protein [Thermoanaerobaculia bacterium]
MTESAGETTGQQPSNDVGRQTVRAAAWGFVAAMGKRVLTLVGLALLARVLAPHDFGLLGFGMMYITFAEIIGDLGSVMTLIYWPERRDDAAQTTFIINVAAGIFWSVVSFLLAPYIAVLFHAPAAAPYVRVLSITTLIKFLGNTHDALAQKDLRFRARTIPELALTGIKAAVALLLATVFKMGAWSLVWGHLAGIASWTILLWVVVPWRPSLRVPKDLFRPMLRYGRSIVMVNVLGAFMFDIDAVVVTRFLGVTALGLYQMAARIPDSSIMVVIWVCSKALFPAFSKLHAEGGDVRGAYLVATRCLSSLTLPAALGMAFLAKPIILVFFGKQWVAAAPILSILSLYVGSRSVDFGFGNMLKSMGRPNTLVKLNVLKAALLVPAVFAGAMVSATAVAAALAAVYFLGTMISTTIASRIVGIPLRSIIRAFAPSVQSGAIMSVALYGWMHWSGPLGPLVQLIGGVLLGALVYITALRLINPEIFGWLRNIVFARSSRAGEKMLQQAAS